MKPVLSIPDPSPLFESQTAAEAFEDTLALTVIAAVPHDVMA